MGKVRAAITILIVLLAVVFAVQNADTVEVRFLAWGFALPRALLVLLLIGAGFVIGLLSSSVNALKRDREDTP